MPYASVCLLDRMSAGEKGTKFSCRLESSLHPLSLLDVYIQLCGAEKKSEALLGFFLIPNPRVPSFAFEVDIDTCITQIIHLRDFN